MVVYLPQFVNVLALAALSCHVRGGCDLALRDPWQVRHDVKSESTEFLHVDALALAEVLVQISDEGPPDDLHLQKTVTVRGARAKLVFRKNLPVIWAREVADSYWSSQSGDCAYPGRHLDS